MARASLKLVVALVAFSLATYVAMASRETSIQDSRIVPNDACQSDPDCDSHCKNQCINGYCGCGCSSPTKAVGSIVAAKENGTCESDTDCDSHCTHQCKDGGCYCNCTN